MTLELTRVPRTAGGVPLRSTYQGPQDYVTPKELDPDGITQTIADYAHAARNAIAAGFDGVEIHGANGYLIHQFLAPNTNLRTHSWGGGAANRARFGIEVATAIAEAIGGHRTGFHLPRKPTTTSPRPTRRTCWRPTPP